MQSDLGKKSEKEVEQQYVKAYKGFYDNVLENEMTRRRALRMTERIEEMSQFLVTGDEENPPKVRKIRLWGADGKKDPLYKKARALNDEKLALAKEGGKFWGEDRDLDIEGERLLREVHEFKKQLVKSHFYDGEIEVEREEEKENAAPAN